MDTELSERQIEDVFEAHHPKLLEPELKLISRQFIFENGKRADMIFTDKNGRKLIVELKRNPVVRKDVGQLMEYFGIMNQEKPRIALVAPSIPKAIKKAFEHFGIEYIEFKLPKIQELYSSMAFNSESSNSNFDPSRIISRNLDKKKLIDGNVAFKVTYVDNDWSHVCSSTNADYNFDHRTWCKIQKDYRRNCQSNYWKRNPPSEKEAPCYDCIAKKTLRFYPGHNHGPKTNNEPRRMLEAKQGKIMLLTSRKPSQPESERFIFGITEIQGFEVEGNPPYEVAKGDPGKSLLFDENKAPLFWSYYSNPNAPKRKAWNTGLLRYVKDEHIYALLSDLKKRGDLDNSQIEVLDYLISILK
ncbi:endonuclease NucS domain-containing protein [Salinimicrobium sp. CAU 1759]